MIHRRARLSAPAEPKLTGKVREVWERRLGTIGAEWTEQFAAETVEEIMRKSEGTK